MSTDLVDRVRLLESVGQLPAIESNRNNVGVAEIFDCCVGSFGSAPRRTQVIATETNGNISFRSLSGSSANRAPVIQTGGGSNDVCLSQIGQDGIVAARGTDLIPVHLVDQAGDIKDVSKIAAFESRPSMLLPRCP